MSRNKSIKIKSKIIVLIVIGIFFFTISVGYSYLRQKVNIYGKATIVTDESGKYIKGNSTYTYEAVEVQNTTGTDSNTEANNNPITNSNNITNGTTYDVTLKITNMDTDIKKWEIAFDVPAGYNDSALVLESNLSHEYKDGRLTIYTNANNQYLARGSMLELKMKITTNGKFSIENLTLNGRTASKT